MPLTDYRKKRAFSRTSEPRGSIKRTSENNRFVIHKHAARRLHYDLRLEIDGVLKSWAVPKGPSLTALEKRLAVNVEDHPMEYLDFEGHIPGGEYGAGDVIIWDMGKWQSMEENPAKAYESGKIKFILRGEKLKGLWMLVKMKGDGKQWLLFKDADEFSSDEDILEKEPGSVISQPRIPGKKRHGKRSGSKEGTPDLAVIPNAFKAPLPKSIKPQLALHLEKPPIGESWLYEIKYDGYRLLCIIDHGKVKLITRNGYDWTDKFIKLAEIIRKIPIESGILDGELTVTDERGISNFQLLQNAISDGKTDNLQYFAVDIPYYNGYSLKQTPLIERKKLLKRILGDFDNGAIIYSEHLAGHAGEVLKSACRLGLEGIMAKDASSGYEEKRTKSWIKVKCVKQQEFVIGGYTEPAGSREKFGALLLGYYKDSKFIYCGKVGTGFDDKTLNSIYQKLKPLKISKSPFVNLKTTEGAFWVKPDLVAEVAFMNWTEDSLLRQASFRGLREDKNPGEIVLEQAEPAGNIQHIPKRAYSPVIAGITVTHPEKVLFKDQGITKFDLAAYYEKIADWMLPHIAGRPLVLVRCPGNINKCFFQKHPVESLPDSIKEFELQKKNSVKSYIYIDNIKSLMALVQYDVIEFHIMDSAVLHPDKPDRMVFDLDPGPEVEPEAVTAAALNLKELLLGYKLESFVKTTGGKGLHLVIPIEYSLGIDEVKEISHFIADKLVERWPTLLTSVMSKEKRKGKIFIDYFRNTAGASWAAPYTVRARPNAPVSMPVNWDELTEDLKFDQFTLLNLDERLKILKKDPWQDIFTIHQKIPKSLIKSLKNNPTGNE